MNDNIYTPPKSELEIGNRKRLKLGKILSIIGSIMQTPVTLYFFTGLIKLIQVFQSITLYGNGDTKVMASGMSNTLSYFIIGALISVPGLIISIVSLFISSYRNRRLFIYSIIIAIFWMISFPIGTIFGVIYLIILLIKK